MDAHIQSIEQAIIGTLMHNSMALTLTAERIKPLVFEDNRHRLICETITGLFHQNEAIDHLIVQHELGKIHKLEEAGGKDYVGMMISKAVTIDVLDYYVNVLYDDYLKRELEGLCAEYSKSRDSARQGMTLIHEIAEKLHKMLEQSSYESARSIDSVIKQVMPEIVAGRDRNVRTGFETIDSMLGGLPLGELVVLGGRPAMGKTALMISMALNMTSKFKTPVAYFSLETNATIFLKRLLSAAASVDCNQICTERMNEDQIGIIQAKSAEVKAYSLYFDDTAGLNTAELLSRLRSLRDRYGVKVAFIDYLQLLEVDSRQGRNNREFAIAEMARGLKRIARELDICIFVASQLSRAVETRGGSKRPTLSDLRESGAIEQDADKVLFLYRPEYYKIFEDEAGRSTAGMAELFLAKNRTGGLPSFMMKFVHEYQRFEDSEPGWEDQNNIYDFLKNRLDEVRE
ncbi:MAG: DnaB-like helicase C-terminal domain-containing protein [Bacteroidota bacterium]